MRAELPRPQAETVGKESPLITVTKSLFVATGSQTSAVWSRCSLAPCQAPLVCMWGSLLSVRMVPRCGEGCLLFMMPAGAQRWPSQRTANTQPSSALALAGLELGRLHSYWLTAPAVVSSTNSDRAIRDGVDIFKVFVWSDVSCCPFVFRRFIFNQLQ